MNKKTQNNSDQTALKLFTKFGQGNFRGVFTAITDTIAWNTLPRGRNKIIAMILYHSSQGEEGRLLGEANGN
jgi:hypothetical protein